MMARKQIMLVLFNVKRMFYEKKVLFILVIISTAISTFGIFFFGDYLAAYYKDLANQMGDSLYIEGNINETYKAKLIDGIGQLELNQISQIICEHTEEEEDGNPVIKGEFHNNYGNRMQSGETPAWDEGRAYIVIDEFRANEIVDELQENEKLLGQKLKVDGKEYTVSGICSITEDDEFIVPVLFYLNHYETNQVEISFQHTLSKQDKERMETLFGSDNLVALHWSDLEEPWEQTEFMVSFVQLLGVFLLIGINIVMLIEYLLYRNKRKYCIYAICGGTDRDIRSIIFWQIFVHMLFGTVLGSILVAVFKQTIGNVEWLYKGSWYLYMWLFVIVVLIQAVTAYGLDWKMNRKLEIYQIEE